MITLKTNLTGSNGVDSPAFDKCPACNSSRLAPRWRVNGFSLLCCQTCSLVFVKERISPDQLKQYYADVHDDVYDDGNAACLAYYYKILQREIDRTIPGRGNILDVGCAGGWFLDLMQGWETHGCELSPGDYEIARSRHGDRILHCNFEEYPLRAGYFDAITLQDVFDHMPDPVGALEKCRALLRPGGLLVIKVHDISCLYAKLTGASFYALIPPSHLFYYNRRSLTALVEKAGFRVTGSRHIGHILKLKTVFFRLSRGDRNSPYYRVFERLNRSSIGDWKLYKNLHDIITVFAVKK